MGEAKTKGPAGARTPAEERRMKVLTSPTPAGDAPKLRKRRAGEWYGDPIDGDFPLSLEPIGVHDQARQAAAALDALRVLYRRAWSARQVAEQTAAIALDWLRVLHGRRHCRWCSECMPGVRGLKEGDARCVVCHGVYGPHRCPGTFAERQARREAEREYRRQTFRVVMGPR